MAMVASNWKNIKGKNGGTSISLVPGTYICRVVDSQDHTAKNGNEGIKLLVDIDEENYYKNYFSKKCGSNIDKWLNEAIKYFSLETEDNQSYLKGFVEAIEESNNVEIKVREDGYLDPTQFKDKLVAVQFGLEEYGKDHKIKRGLKITGFYSIDKKDTVEIPDVRLLNGTYVSYRSYAIDNNLPLPEQQTTYQMQLD